VAADARESIRRDTDTLATVTGTELKESVPCTDVEEDEDELEGNKLVLEDCYSIILCLLQSLNCNCCILPACLDIANRFMNTCTCYSNISCG